MRWLSIFLVLTLLVVLPVVVAEQQTHQFTKVYMNPLYRESMEDDVNYTYSLIVDTPDGISNVVNAMVTMQLWLNPTVNFQLWVNDQSCNTLTYQVHTTYANAGEGTVFFDCSNIINSEGNYEVIIQSDKNTGASTFWVDLTYANDPDGDLELFGTEYRQGENGTVFLQLQDSNGNTVNNGTCQIDIYYPDKTKWMDSVSMEFLENGLFYIDLFMPTTAGVYMMAVDCEYENIHQSYNIIDSFDYDGSLDGGSQGSSAELQDSDCVFAQTKTSTYQQFNFVDAGIGNINFTTLDKVHFDWIGQNEKEPSYLSAYNFTSATWVQLGTTFDKSENSNGDCSGSHGVSRDLPDDLENFRSVNEMRFRINQASGKILSDKVDLHFHSTGTSINDIRGSGEIHINDWFNNYTGLISDAVWSWGNRSLTEPVNISGTDLTAITNGTAEAVWSYSGNVSGGLLTQIADTIWNYVARYTHGVDLT